MMLFFILFGWTMLFDSAAAAVPSVQQIDAAAGSATCGSISVTWPARAPSPSMDTQTLTLHAADTTGNSVLDVSQEVVGMGSFGPNWCGDLLGDGSQVLAYSSFSGGAHCCFEGSLVVLDGSGRHLLDWSLGSFWVQPPQQLDGGGPLEIPAGSPLFNYYDDLGFANSPVLPIVYAYDGSHYVEATAHFPAYLAQEVTSTEAGLAAARAPNADQRAYALELYALHLLLGDGEQALANLQTRINPAARSWLAAHAADVRSKMSSQYSLLGAPPAAAAAAPTIIPAPVTTANSVTPASDAPDGNSAPSASPTDAQPASLTDAVRSDILSAVNRANTAWTTASHTLDDSVLVGNVAGSELSDDMAELNDLRGRGQSRNNVNTSFVVTNVTLDAPGQATVHTHEVWYAEIYGPRGQLLQRTPSTNYDETYTVEFQNGGWIVTRNVV
ncbi:MAG TPA: hypothetical protein VGJ60_09810 [Chloroflexota bacterium]